MDTTCAGPVPVHQEADPRAILERVRPYLDDLAARIDTEIERRIFAA